MIGSSLDHWKKTAEHFESLPQGENRDPHSRNYPREVIELAEAMLREDRVLMAREDVWLDAYRCVVIELLNERRGLREEVQELESRYDNLLADIGGVSPG